MEPTFPGFDTCLAWMRNWDPMTQEEGFFTLLPHAAAFVPELIQEYIKEGDHGLQYWLIELICSTKSPVAFDFLAAQLQSDDQRRRFMAMQGLKLLGTQEAHTLLWEARLFKFGSPEDTEAFQADLHEVLNKRNFKA